MFLSEWFQLAMQGSPSQKSLYGLHQSLNNLQISLKNLETEAYLKLVLTPSYTWARESSDLLGKG